MPRRKKRVWGFDAEQREVLLASTVALPELRAIVARAEPLPQVAGLWVVRATVDELDEMYSLVEELIDVTRSRRQRELLEGMLASLCTSIDGF